MRWRLAETSVVFFLAGVLALLATFIAHRRPAPMTATPAAAPPRPPCAAARPSPIPVKDAIAAFLARHWRWPLPAQGPPPSDYSPLEASLSPESCGSCHQDQYRGWRGSLHSHAGSDLVYWYANSPRSAGCLRCHAPLTEQAEEATLHWFNRPQPWPVPEYADPQLYRRGVVCASCHVREHERYGPPARAALAAMPTVHHRFTAEAAFEDSRFCATCHITYLRPVNGKPIGNTFEEWKRSRFADEGVSCQHCHMPDRRHLWRGIHDPAMVLTGVHIELTVEQHQARAELTSVHIGHRFPTYCIPHVIMSLYRRGRDGALTLLDRYTIGRYLELSLEDERWDHRLEPGQSAHVSGKFATAADVVLQIDVDPRNFYERQLLNAVQTPKVRGLLTQEYRYRYRLLHMVVPVPSRPGQRVVHSAGAPIVDKLRGSPYTRSLFQSHAEARHS